MRRSCSHGNQHSLQSSRSSRGVSWLLSRLGIPMRSALSRGRGGERQKGRAREAGRVNCAALRCDTVPAGAQLALLTKQTKRSACVDHQESSNSNNNSWVICKCIHETVCVCVREVSEKAKEFPRQKPTAEPETKGEQQNRGRRGERAREMDFWNEIKVICCRFVPFKWNQNILHK